MSADKPPMPILHRFSHHARRALGHARALSNRYRHPIVDSGHLLVGVMLTEGSIGSSILQAMNLTAAHAESHLSRLYPLVDLSILEMTNSVALETALALAADESTWLGHHYVGTEHLLLGITRTNAGNAGTLLQRLGSSSWQVRLHVRRALRAGASEIDLQFVKRNASLSELSRRVIIAAEQLADRSGHSTVGLGHLLLVLLGETRSPMSALLRQCGLESDLLYRGLAGGDPLLFLPVALILSQAIEQGENSGSHYTGTEHLLWTLAHDPDGAKLLSVYGADVDQLRHRLMPQS